VRLKITRPSAGLRTESLWAVVILGGKNPFWVLETSSMAELCLGVPFSLMATPCDSAAVEKQKKVTQSVNKVFTVNLVLKLVFYATHTVGISPGVAIHKYKIVGKVEIAGIGSTCLTCPIETG